MTTLSDTDISHKISLPHPNMNIYELPAFIEDQKTTKVARKIINLGLTDDLIHLGTDYRKYHPVPVKLDVTEKLSIEVDHLLIGDLEIVGDLKNLTFSCKKLTVCKPLGENPEWYHTLVDRAMHSKVRIIHFIQARRQKGYKPSQP